MHAVPLRADQACAAADTELEDLGLFRRRLLALNAFNITYYSAVLELKNGVCFSAHADTAGIDYRNVFLNRVIWDMRMPE